MAGKAQDQEEISDINIVPLVDIILVVLIIFMITSPIQQQGSLKVDLPQASTDESSDSSKRPFNLTVTEDGELLVAGEVLSESELKLRVEQESKINPDIEAMIAADQILGYGQVIRVIDLVKASGISKVTLTTSSEMEE